MQCFSKRLYSVTPRVLQLLYIRQQISCHGLDIHHVRICIACDGVLLAAFYKSVIDYKVYCIVCLGQHGGIRCPNDPNGLFGKFRERAWELEVGVSRGNRCESLIYTPNPLCWHVLKIREFKREFHLSLFGWWFWEWKIIT